MRILSSTAASAMAKSDPSLLISTSGARWLSRIREIADDILLHREEAPLILLSGPSGSGKTTTALMLERMLDSMGAETHTISMDNFFCPMDDEQIAAMKEGKVNLESPDRLDSVLLHDTLESLIDGRETPMPTYNFVTSQREYRGDTLTRKPGEVLLLEGIHALNPAVITLPDSKSVRVYVSVRSRLELPDGTLFHPDLTRLCRRLLRDRAGRDRSFLATLELYDSVEKGELDFIAPYKHRANWDVDTFFDCELCVYRPLLADGLREIEHPLAEKLLAGLTAMPPIDVSLLPADSLLHEFVG